jgi:putative membrane protein
LHSEIAQVLQIWWLAPFSRYYFFVSDSPTSLTNELARERNREAADRTLLAWIRTSLAMISLGFGIERLGQAALSLDGRMAAFSPVKTRLFGAALIALGVAATLAGMWEHKRVLASISGDDYRYADRPPIARYMGIALVIVGLAALAMMLVHFSSPEGADVLPGS